MKTMQRGTFWTVIYLVLAYSLGFVATMLGGGGHGVLTPFKIYILFTLPSSLTLPVLDLIKAPYSQGSDTFGHIQRISEYFLYLAPLINSGLLWLIASAVKTIRKRKS